MCNKWYLFQLSTPTFTVACTISLRHICAYQSMVRWNQCKNDSISVGHRSQFSIYCPPADTTKLSLYSPPASSYLHPAFSGYWGRHRQATSGATTKKWSRRLSSFGTRAGHKATIVFITFIIPVSWVRMIRGWLRKHKKSKIKDRTKEPRFIFSLTATFFTSDITEFQ